MFLSTIHNIIYLHVIYKLPYLILEKIIPILRFMPYLLLLLYILNHQNHYHPVKSFHLHPLSTILCTTLKHVTTESGLSHDIKRVSMMEAYCSTNPIVLATSPPSPELVCRDFFCLYYYYFFLNDYKMNRPILIHTST